jgi:alginate O-acetyltransferase complex protein AlgI
MFMDVKNKFAINFTMPKLLRISWVFAVVTCAWLLFRLPEFSHATAYINAISTNQHLGVQPANIFYILFYSLPVITMHAYALIGESNRGPKLVNRKILMHAARIIMFFLLMTSFGPKSEFIYFQF